MKKLIVALVAIVALSASAMAQGKGGEFSLGLRLGDAWFTSFDNSYGSDWGFNIELSGVYNLSSSNRIEAELGWADYSWSAYGVHHANGYLHLAGSYQWYWNIIKGLGWYVGPSANLGVWIYDAHYSGYHSSDAAFCLGVGGQIGIQYDFDFPLQLSLDTRPSINFGIPGDIKGSAYFWPTWFNFSVRYRF